MANVTDLALLSEQVEFIQATGLMIHLKDLSEELHQVAADDLDHFLAPPGRAQRGAPGAAAVRRLRRSCKRLQRFDKRYRLQSTVKTEEATSVCRLLHLQRCVFRSHLAAQAFHKKCGKNAVSNSQVKWQVKVV